MLIGLFLRLGLGQLGAKIASIGTIVLLAAAALLWVHHAGYRDGVNTERGRWEAAQRKLVEKAAAAASSADAAATQREISHAAELGREKEKIDAAQREGRSPLDVLFGTDSVP